MKQLRMFETTLKNGETVRIMAEDQYQARQRLQELYGLREVIYLPRIVPH